MAVLSFKMVEKNAASLLQQSLRARLHRHYRTGITANK